MRENFEKFLGFIAAIPMLFIAGIWWIVWHFIPAVVLSFFFAALPAYLTSLLVGNDSFRYLWLAWAVVIFVMAQFSKYSK